jgi:hypothetical protein
VITMRQESLTIQKVGVPQLRGGVLTTRTVITPGAGAVGGRASAASAQGKFQQAFEKFGMKIGLRIARGQSASLEIPGAKVGESREVTRELERTFSSRGGERWVGFDVRRGGGKRGGSAKQVTTFKLRGFRNPGAQAFQLMPVVLSLGGQKFAEHHLLGVSVLYAQARLVDTRVDSRFAGTQRKRR